MAPPRRRPVTRSQDQKSQNAQETKTAGKVQVEASEHVDSPQVPTNEGNQREKAFGFFEEFLLFCQQKTRGNDDSHKQATRENDQDFERFLRFHPPRFAGEPDDQKAEEWLEEIEKIFKVMGYTNQQRVSFASFKLEGDAHNWWRIVEHKWTRDETPHTWASFLKEFNSKFIPQVVKDQRERDFMNLIQGTMTVAEYEAQFNRLIKYAPHYLGDEERQSKKFISGLKPKIQWAILAVDIVNYTHAVEKAMHIESGIQQLESLENQTKMARPANQDWQGGRRTGQGSKFQRTNVGNPSKQPLKLTQESNKRNGANNRCTHCGNPGHSEVNCWKKHGKCVKCGSGKHFIRDCPQMKCPSSVAGNHGRPSSGQAKKSRVQARAFALGGGDASDPTAVVEECVLTTEGLIMSRSRIGILCLTLTNCLISYKDLRFILSWI
ncbi:hypothetical protein ACJIZ3_019276 [Penstemon smallii]|uniref:CCHC-type domain-containing protein n=1 Tax=Penstemon smallii TaxID=265156 RepID=A0ABD3T0Q5_9LAMI